MQKQNLADSQVKIKSYLLSCRFLQQAKFLTVLGITQCTLKSFPFCNERLYLLLKATRLNSFRDAERSKKFDVIKENSNVYCMRAHLIERVMFFFLVIVKLGKHKIKRLETAMRKHFFCFKNRLRAHATLLAFFLFLCGNIFVSKKPKIFLNCFSTFCFRNKLPCVIYHMKEKSWLQFVRHHNGCVKKMEL